MFLAIACLSLPAWGADIGLYSTGVDASGTALQTQGSVDLRYKIISTSLWPYDPYTYVGNGLPFQEPTGRVGVGGFNSAFVVYNASNPWGLANGPYSQWIAPVADSRTGIGQLIWTYQTTFDLTGFNPTSARIAGSWAVDDPGWIYLNGQLVAELPYRFMFQQLYGSQVPLFNPGYIANHDFLITSGFLPGVNTLEFVVGNLSLSPSGLRVEIASATANSVPNLSCEGFENPISNGPMIVRNNRVLPLKAQLVDPYGIVIIDTDIISPPFLQVVRVNNGGEPPIDVTSESISAGHGSERNQFVFTSDGKWQFNLMTRNYSAPGTYTISILTGDSTEYGINPSCTATFIVE